MKINIRKVTAQDYDIMCDLFDEIDALHRNALPRMFKKPDGPAREHDYYLGLIADENAALFIAEADGKPAGYVYGIVKDAPDFPVFVPRHHVVIDNIAIKAEFQNRGLGKTLMDKMREWAIEKGATSIELSVYEFNKNAMLFYERLGYQTLSRKMSMDLTGNAGD